MLIMLHTLFFGSAGKNTMRKRQLRLFAGFPEDSPSRASLVEKITKANKKWTVPALKTAAGLFGLEKGGSREEIIERFVDFIISPSELKGVPAAKAKAKAGGKKRKAATGKKDKGDQPKRAATPYLLFSVASRAAIKAQNPEATFGEVAKLLGAAWKSLEGSAKDVWVAAAAAAANVMESNGVEADGKKKKSTKKRKIKATAAVEEEEEEEEGEDRDKDLFPDSDEEA